VRVDDDDVHVGLMNGVSLLPPSQTITSASRSAASRIAA
jgi:hypothetical protein